MMALAGAAAVCCAASLAVTATPAIATVAPASGWGKAIEVPGLARLSAGHGGSLGNVACSSPGNCATGGDYIDRNGRNQAFVVSEKNGTWGTAIEVPGLAALNTGGNATLMWLSCGSAGNCAAGGSYNNGPGRGQAFVVSEKNGTWGRAIEVPGSAALSGAAGYAEVDAVSCASAGNCTAAGTYSRKTDQQAFVVSEKNGTWGRAIEVPGLAAHDANAPVGVSAVSCASAGNCAVVGSYAAAPPLAFAVSQKNGSWGNAIEVPGSLSLEGITLASVSCASAGNCTAAGSFGDRYGEGILAPLVVSEKNGTWGKATLVPGTAADSRNGAGPVSCASAGNCVVGGDVAPIIYGPYQAFVASQQNGTWGKATGLPGLTALNASGNASVDSVSCESAGNCAAGGYYEDSAGHTQAFVVSENSGWWGRAIEVPGSAALNTGGYAQIESVSCTAAGYCAATGYYMEPSGNAGAFLVSRT
jgi:hypothetical protein